MMCFWWFFYIKKKLNLIIIIIFFALYYKPFDSCVEDSILFFRILNLDDDDDRIPRYFNFEGRIIFISNLPLDKLDPDKALRTRAFVISINPTPEEIMDRMQEILYTIKLEDGLTLSKKEREKVFEVVKNGKRKEEISLRTLVRALNLAASGAPNWETLILLYA